MSALSGMKMVTEPTKLIRGQIDALIPTTKTVTLRVGPIEANELLSYSPGNVRRESDRKIAQYARDMKAGRWIPNHQGLAFTQEGQMIDGHHRLQAVIASGCTIPFPVTFGLQSRAVITVDVGNTRSAAQQLKRTNRETACIRLALRLESRIAARQNESIQELEYGFDKYAEELKFFGPLIGQNKFVSPFWGTLLFAHAVNPARVEQLALQIVNGQGIVGTGFVLREFLLKSNGQNHLGGLSSAMRTVFHTLVATRAFIEGREIGRIAAPITREGPKKGVFESATLDWFLEQREELGK